MKKHNINYKNKIFIIESIRKIIIDLILSEDISELDSLLYIYSKYIDELTIIVNIEQK